MNIFWNRTIVIKSEPMNYLQEQTSPPALQVGGLGQQLALSNLCSYGTAIASRSNTNSSKDDWKQ